MTQTVIGIFDTPDTAYAAGDALVEQGVEQSSIYISAKEGTKGAAGKKGQSIDAIRSFLSEIFGPENSQDADSYVKEIDRGAVLLSVDLPDDIDINPICDVIQDAGAVNMEAQGAGQASGYSAEQSRGGSEAIPVVEEQMEVGKRKVAQGSVRVVSRMVETPVQEDVMLRDETATVTRRPVDRPISPEDVGKMGDRSIEVEETSEKAVMSKNARVVEEIEVGKETSERTETIEGTERRTEVEVERTPSPKGGKRASK